MEQSTWSLWVGPEVEGRLVGMRTLFVRELPDDLREIVHGHDHIWLCKEYIERHGYALAEELIEGGVTVSIELTLPMLTDVPARVQQMAHLVLALPAPDIARTLKPTDTVRLDAAPFDIYTMTFGQTQHTPPGHYQQDRRIV